MIVVTFSYLARHLLLNFILLVRKDLDYGHQKILFVYIKKPRLRCRGFCFSRKQRVHLTGQLVKFLKDAKILKAKFSHAQFNLD